MIYIYNVILRQRLCFTKHTNCLHSCLTPNCATLFFYCLHCIESSLIDFFVQLLNWQLLRIHQVQQTKWITYNTYTIQKDAKKWKRGGGLSKQHFKFKKELPRQFQWRGLYNLHQNFFTPFYFFFTPFIFFTLHYTSKLKNIESARKSSCTSAYNHVQCW